MEYNPHKIVWPAQAHWDDYLFCSVYSSSLDAVQMVVFSTVARCGLGSMQFVVYWNSSHIFPHEWL